MCPHYQLTSCPYYQLTPCLSPAFRHPYQDYFRVALTCGVSLLLGPLYCNNLICACCGLPRGLKVLARRFWPGGFGLKVCHMASRCLYPPLIWLPIHLKPTLEQSFVQCWCRTDVPLQGYRTFHTEHVRWVCFSQQEQQFQTVVACVGAGVA